MQTPVSPQFFQTGGSLPANFPTYITRPADEELYQHLIAGKFCYVLTARQMGKSSLRVRVMERLKKEKGIICISVDTTKIGNRNSTAEQWYYSLLHEITGNLGLRSELRNWWKEKLDLTPVYRFGEFLEHVCLQKIREKIILFIDEIDAMLELDNEKFSTDDFFAIIRVFTMPGSTTPISPGLPSPFWAWQPPTTLCMIRRAPRSTLAKQSVFKLYF